MLSNLKPSLFTALLTAAVAAPLLRSIPADPPRKPSHGQATTSKAGTGTTRR